MRHSDRDSDDDRFVTDRTRRAFLRRVAAAAALAGLGAGPIAAAQEAARHAAKEKTAKGKAPRKLRILILGGTRFLGPQVVDAARKHGHTLTLFNRGKTHPGLFPDIEKLQGDRDGNLKALEGRKWDAVVDTSGYVPRVVRASADLLKDAVQHYVFVSTISVYAKAEKPGMDESGPVATIADPTNENVKENYGALKALCEGAAEQSMPGRVTNVRPGLIVGPGDPTDRFTYWPVRVARGGEVLAPGTPADPVQYIDVRDLGDWIVKAIEDRTVGVYNAVGPKEELGIGGLLDACNATGGGKATFTWADAAFLDEQKVAAWSDMPVWVPPIGEDAGFSRISSARAIARGLTFRPVEETTRATLEWFRTEPAEHQAKLTSGLSPEREAEVLAAWHARPAQKG
jgi:nucleoside-diphosphate-sugar epimerase